MAIITKSCGNFLDADGYFIDKKIIYFLGIPIYTYEFISANENIIGQMYKRPTGLYDVNNIEFKTQNNDNKERLK